MKTGLTPTPRPDLSKDNPNFESVWVEIEENNGKNYLLCCTYGHCNSAIDTFNDYLQEILSNPAVSRLMKNDMDHGSWRSKVQTSLRGQ